MIGALLSIAGLSLLVFGVLQSGTWGFVKAKPGHLNCWAPRPWSGSSPAACWSSTASSCGRRRRSAGAANRSSGPAMLRNPQLAGGLSMFFFQFFIQAGVFFTIPLFLSVVLELSALQTGVRLLPLSFALLAAAVGIPRLGAPGPPAPGRAPGPAVHDRRDPGAHRRDQPGRGRRDRRPSRCC